MNSIERNLKRPSADMDTQSVKTVTMALNDLLANEYALFTKTLNYHWNITGPRFHSLHQFLEEQYTSLLKMMDSLAERVRILGEAPVGTVKMMYERMSLKERDGSNLSSNEMLTELFLDNMKIQSFIKETISNENLFSKDPGTEDYLVSILQKHENMSWMLKSHLD